MSKLTDAVVRVVEVAPKLESLAAAGLAKIADLESENAALKAEIAALKEQVAAGENLEAAATLNALVDKAELYLPKVVEQDFAEARGF